MLMIRNHRLAGEPVACRAAPHASFDSVAVEGGGDIEGWVNNRFIVRLKDAPRSLVARSRAMPSEAVKKAAKKKPSSPRPASKGRGSQPR